MPKQTTNQLYRKRATKWENRHVIAVDGEGYTTPDGRHIYNLLSSSNGKYLHDDNGLSTDSIFEFLLSGSDPNDITVIFGGSYDANMWLRDVPFKQLVHLWNEGCCYYKHFKITYIPRKVFTITEWEYTKNQKPKRGRSITIWDVIGFFQSSFVKACKLWLGDLPILAEIQSMKEQRNSFDAQSIDSVLDYNTKECELLCLLMYQLFDALDEAEIVLARYDGAGAIAGALFKKYNVKDYIPEQNNYSYYALMQAAYAGGRIEALKVGRIKRPVYNYDLNSAYPWAATYLPDLTTSDWIESDELNDDPFSLVEVSWSCSKRSLYPVFYRESNGLILYPQAGSGVYYACEIQNFEPGEYTIHRVINLVRNTDKKPFDFIPTTYSQRLSFKRQGKMAANALKLGLNSVYGKLAQQEGFQSEDEIKIPSTHCLAYAGMITALVRSTIYKVCMQSPESIIAIATDGIFSQTELNLDEGVGLGQWSKSVWAGMTIVQPGVYWLHNESEDLASYEHKYRGFNAGTLKLEDILAKWQANEESLSVSTTRFMGLGGSLARRDFYEHWTRWETSPRTISLRSKGKRSYAGDITKLYNMLQPTTPRLPLDANMLSCPYPVKWIDGTNDLRNEDNLLIETELFDSFE